MDGKAVMTQKIKNKMFAPLKTQVMIIIYITVLSNAMGFVAMLLKSKNFPEIYTAENPPYKRKELQM